VSYRNSMTSAAPPIPMCCRRVPISPACGLRCRRWSRSLDQTRNRLAVYEGKLPSELQASDLDLEQMKLPQDIPLSLPSELVKQRPDILVADAQLHQASAGDRHATAEIAAADHDQRQLRHRCDPYLGPVSRDGIWSIGAGVTQPLLHFGELRAKRRAAVAAYDQAAAQYQQTVLLAFQNVADSLRALDHDAQALQSQYEADAAAQESLQLTQKRYDLGATSYLDLLTRSGNISRRGSTMCSRWPRVIQDTAALFQALGGSWDGLARHCQPLITRTPKTNHCLHRPRATDRE